MVLLEEQQAEDRKKLASATKLSKDLRREKDAKIGTLESRIEQLTDTLSKSDNEKSALVADNKRLKSLTASSSEQINALQQTNVKLEQSISHLTSRISQLEALAGSTIVHKEQLQASLKRIDDLEAENRRLKENLSAGLTKEEQLTLQIQSLNDSFASLQEQFNQLSSTASRLQADNMELRHAGSGSDQNDVLNQRLLSHYRYLVQLTEDQESDEGGSDSEAWK